MKDHSRRAGPAPHHLRAADDANMEVVRIVEEAWASTGRECDFDREPWAMSELDRVRMDRDIAQGDVLLWKMATACAWGIVLVMLFT